MRWRALYSDGVHYDGITPGEPHANARDIDRSRLVGLAVFRDAYDLTPSLHVPIPPGSLLMLRQRTLIRPGGNETVGIVWLESPGRTDVWKVGRVIEHQPERVWRPEPEEWEALTPVGT